MSTELLFVCGGFITKLYIESLAPYYLYEDSPGSPLDVRNFGRDIENADPDSLRDRFSALFARLPYPTDERGVEQTFQNAVYITFMLLGQFVQTEIHSAKGTGGCDSRYG